MFRVRQILKNDGSNNGSTPGKHLVRTASIWTAQIHPEKFMTSFESEESSALGTPTRVSRDDGAGGVVTMRIPGSDVKSLALQHKRLHHPPVTLEQFTKTLTLGD